MTAQTATLAATLWPAPTAHGRALGRNAALVVAGVCALTASAKIQIPFWPVPLTLQTLVVLALGMGYGRRLGLATMLGYLGAGAAGAPVLAAGAGLAYFAGPTGGYLAGFLLATLLMGWLGERGWGRTPLSMIVPMLAGTAAIYLLGVAWLAYLFDLPTAVNSGLLPFLVGDALKLALAMALVPSIWRLARKRDS